MDFNINQFHFIRPLCLLLIPAAIVLWYGLKRAAGQSAWDNYIPKEMLQALRIERSARSNFTRWAILLVWLVLISAAAGPSWNKQAVPTVKNQKALAIILDLSPSMLAQDLTPNRLTRARYKIIDILRRQQDGQVALIAYAGDAHTVSPLTDDPRTIEALLPALHPGVMPSSGSNTEAAIQLAQQLLDDARAPNGDILLISDGVTERAASNIAKLLSVKHRLSVLAVGSSEATPIPVKGGGLLRGSNGEIVLASVNRSELRALANSSGGKFASVSSDDSDIENLVFSDFENLQAEDAQNQTSYDAWADSGYLLVLLILPLVMWFFRRGLVYVVPLFFILPMTSEAADSGSFWRNLWQTPDQQGTQLMRDERYDEAANTFQRDDWSAVANYRNDNFQESAALLDGKDDVTSLYNRGNALAFSGDLEAAIAAYEEVLLQQPKHADALHNKAVLEKLQQQQQDQGSEQDQKNSQQEQQSDQNQSAQDGQQQDQQSSEQDQTQPSDQQANSEGQQSNESQQEDAEQEQQGTGEQEQTESANSEQQQEALAEQQQEALAEQQSEGEKQEESPSAEAAVEQSQTPLKNTSEQWLRGIPDDPSGLLRRKFEYQSRQRQQSGERHSKQPAQERY